MADYTYTDADWRENAKYGLVGVTADDATAHWDRWLAAHDAKVRAEAIREYVEAARENPHTLYWPASGVLDDAEQWADEIEKGMT